MINFRPEEFFDLSAFKYSDIFKLKEPVWQGLGELKNYLQSQLANFKGRLIKGEVQKGAVLDGENIFIDKGTLVEPGAMIKGPTIIGKNCQIRHGAYIRERVLIGNDCTVGNSTEVKDSILFPGVKMAHLNYIGDSILGNNVNLGTGAKLANLRLDKKEIKIYYQKRKIKTNLKKLGAILGDNVSIGTNAVCNPGTILAKNCKVYPLVSVKGYYKSGSIIK